MSSKPETLLSRRCMEIVEQYGGKVIKIHGSAYQEVGTPDLLGAVPPDIHFFVELKNPGEEATPIQLYRLMQWAKLGFKTAVVERPGELRHLIELWIDEVDRE